MRNRHASAAQKGLPLPRYSSKLKIYREFLELREESLRDSRPCSGKNPAQNVN